MSEFYTPALQEISTILYFHFSVMIQMATGALVKQRARASAALALV